MRPTYVSSSCRQTLATDSLQAYLDQAPLIQASGQLYPVDTIYRPAPPRTHWIDHAVETILLTAERTPGDILVFLPGVGEIYRIEQALRGAKLNRWSILPLHGSLPFGGAESSIMEGQSASDVLATNVAETSLTLEGIRTVIDTGMVRVMRFDPSVGLDRLELEPICQASAEQRSGRAGRTQADNAFAVGSFRHHGQTSLPRARNSPSGCCRDFAFSSINGVKAMVLPSLGFRLHAQRRLRQPIGLLTRLHAIDRNEITEVGKAMSFLPVSPRLARLLIEGHRLDCLREVALVALCSRSGIRLSRIRVALLRPGKPIVGIRMYVSGCGLWNATCAKAKSRALLERSIARRLGRLPTWRISSTTIRKMSSALGRPPPLLCWPRTKRRG